MDENADAASIDVDDSRSFLDNEIEALQSIYINETVVYKDEHSTVVSIDLHPSTADNLREQYVKMTLKLALKEGYPEVIPEVNIRNPRGLSDEKLNSIIEDLIDIAESKRGSSMLFEIIEAAKDHLTAENRPCEECAICLYGFQDDDIYTKTECYHYFHSHCLARYSKNAASSEKDSKSEETIEESELLCPVCRLPIHFEESEDLYPPPTRGGEEFVVTNDILDLQKKMSDLYLKQVEKGGIIDLEAERNKYLLEISQVPTTMDDTRLEDETNSSVTEVEDVSVASPVEPQSGAIQSTSKSTEMVKKDKVDRRKPNEGRTKRVEAGDGNRYDRNEKRLEERRSDKYMDIRKNEKYKEEQLHDENLTADQIDGSATQEYSDDKRSGRYDLPRRNDKYDSGDRRNGKYDYPRRNDKYVGGRISNRYSEDRRNDRYYNDRRNDRYIGDRRNDRYNGTKRDGRYNADRRDDRYIGDRRNYQYNGDRRNYRYNVDRRNFQHDRRNQQDDKKNDQYDEEKGNEQYEGDFKNDQHEGGRSDEKYNSEDKYECDRKDEKCDEDRKNYQQDEDKNDGDRRNFRYNGYRRYDRYNGPRRNYQYNERKNYRFDRNNHWKNDSSGFQDRRRNERQNKSDHKNVEEEHSNISPEIEQHELSQSEELQNATHYEKQFSPENVPDNKEANDLVAASQNASKNYASSNRRRSEMSNHPFNRRNKFDKNSGPGRGNEEDNYGRRNYRNDSNVSNGRRSDGSKNFNRDYNDYRSQRRTHPKAQSAEDVEIEDSNVYKDEFLQQDGASENIGVEQNASNSLEVKDVDKCEGDSNDYHSTRKELVKPNSSFEGSRPRHNSYNKYYQEGRSEREDRFHNRNHNYRDSRSRNYPSVNNRQSDFSNYSTRTSQDDGRYPPKKQGRDNYHSSETKNDQKETLVPETIKEPSEKISSGSTNQTSSKSVVVESPVPTSTFLPPMSSVAPPPGFLNPSRKIVYGLAAAKPPPGFNRS